MKRISTGLLLALVACSPDIANTPPTAVTVAQFDPTATVPLVPTPNDLATNPATGLLAVTAPSGSSGADVAFYAWLNTLDGFPGAATAQATFSAALDPASVTTGSVKVLDLDAASAAVTVAPVYADSTDTTSPGVVKVPPPTGGWVMGHRYAVAIIGGSSGVKGKDGTPVVASPTWSLVRVSKSLVTCTDLASADCRPATEIIPSTVIGDEAKRLADQTKSAIALEHLRLKYAPVLSALISGSVTREDVVLAWTFKVMSGPEFVFDPAATPPSVPTPTNLVLAGGKLNIPVDPTSSPAYQEFTTDYLNTLNGYPPNSPANATTKGADLDPASVSSAAFKVLPLSGGALSGAPSFSYDATTKRFTVSPAGGSWGKAKTIAIAALGGVAGGLKGSNGLALAASDAFALARSASSLVDCTSGTCKATVKAAPISDAQASALEALRAGYKPVFDAFEASGTKRINVVGLWVFSTVNQPELTFDLAAATPIIPFPSNQFLRSTDDTAPTGKLTFPIPAGAAGALFAGLNTLDGFSTTAPIVSENSDTAAALDVGHIDAVTFDGGVGFAKLSGSGTLQPNVTVCLNCTSSDAGSPEQLQWVPQRPLEEKARYAGWVSTSLADTTGRKAMASGTFALVRLKNSLVDGNGKSTLPVITDAQANALEPYRVKYKDCLDQVEAQGVARKNIALAYCYTTQSTVSVVKTLAGVVAATPPATLPDIPTMLVKTTAQVTGLMDAVGAPHNAIGDIYTGVMVGPWGLSDATGTLIPTPASWTGRKLYFTLFLPGSGVPMPSAGYPVTIFGHGLSGNRFNTIGIANSLAAAGFATIAIDVVFHGDRTTCVGSKAVTKAPSDDYACADPVNQMCDTGSGRCVARTPATACDPAGLGDATCYASGPGLPGYKGLCQTSGANVGKCEEGDFARNTDGTVKIAAWNYLDLVNLFATRDHFRYTGSVDFAALVRLLKSNATNSLNTVLPAIGGGALLDTGHINYAGQSLGSFNGSVFAAASTTANNMALNVAGSSQVDVLLSAPAFAAQRAGFLAGLAALGITPGAPAFDQFMVLARTILDPADPQNMGYAAVNSSNANRNVYIQTIQGDVVLPNFTADLLIGAANQGTKQAQTFRFTEGTGAGFIPASFPAAARHGFLLTPANDPEPSCSTNPISAPCATAVAQAKVVTFLLTGVAP